MIESLKNYLLYNIMSILCMIIINLLIYIVVICIEWKMVNYSYESFTLSIVIGIIIGNILFFGYEEEFSCEVEKNE